ncbi:hypothetical protein CIB48_g3671 [Xylaria polymorpha]|nr:hypothetical protein CIB48_g3671 [Xylaria polymorpha]
MFKEFRNKLRGGRPGANKTIPGTSASPFAPNYPLAYSTIVDGKQTRSKHFGLFHVDGNAVNPEQYDQHLVDIIVVYGLQGDAYTTSTTERDNVD